MLATSMDSVRDGEMIAPRRMADRLRMPVTGLARVARLNRNILSSKASSAAVQGGLGEIATIIARAAKLLEEKGRAIIWFRHQPMAGWSGKTAEPLVSEGHAEGVLWYLDGLENGEYA